MKIHPEKSLLRIALPALILLLFGSCAPTVSLNGPEKEPASKQITKDQTPPLPQETKLAKKGGPPSYRPQKVVKIYPDGRTQETVGMVQPEKIKKPEEIPIPVKTEKIKAPAPSKTPPSPKKRKKTRLSRKNRLNSRQPKRPRSSLLKHPGPRASWSPCRP